MTLTQAEYRVLAGLSNETPIMAFKHNITFPYKVTHPGSVRVQLPMLYKLVARGLLHSKFTEAGLCPPIRFTITDEGIAAVQKHEETNPPKRARGGE